MTTWASGDLITAAALNEFEKIRNASTWTTDRQTFSANSTYDLASNVVAANLVLAGTTTVTTGKQYEGITFRSMTNNVSGSAYSTNISYLNTCTVTDSTSYAYGMIGSLSAISGAGKVSGIYSRVTHAAAAYTGVVVAGTFAVGSVTGSTMNGVSTILSLAYDAADITVALPLGISIYSNDTGSIIQNVFAVDDSIDVTQCVIQWNQNAAPSGTFLRMYDSSIVSVWQVDYLGNLAFGATKTGQRITGNFSDGTVANRLALKDGNTNANTYVTILPNGTASIAGITAYSSAAGTTGASLRAIVSGGNAYLSLDYLSTSGQFYIGTDGSDQITIDQATGDLLIGKSGVDVADTSGHFYIQAVAGAPTGVPTDNYVGYVAMRYDKTNNKIYVYNSGWKATAALT